MTQTPAKLIYSKGADIYYETGLDFSDPFVWYKAPDGTTHVIISPLEVEVARREGRVDTVHSLTDIAKMIRKKHKTYSTPLAIDWLIAHTETSQKKKAQPIDVSGDLPVGIARALENLGHRIHVVEGWFQPERILKSKEEIEKIRTAQHLNQKGFERAFEILKAADISKGGQLIWQGKPLTSEIVRAEMNSVQAFFGCTAMEGGPIVACGAQSAEPHNRGEGPLYAHEFIIIDSFPRADNMYYGDLTRTVLKGTPTQWHLDVYDAVKSAQKLALDAIQPEFEASEIHKRITDYFDARGFKTGQDAKGRDYGFFHGTGHALGLEVHDKGPGIGRPGLKSMPLKTGMVVTVEPGLYYPSHLGQPCGGVRIEDIVAVSATGCDNLTTLKKELVID